MRAGGAQLPAGHDVHVDVGRVRARRQRKAQALEVALPMKTPAQDTACQCVRDLRPGQGGKAAIGQQSCPSSPRRPAWSHGYHPGGLSSASLQGQAVRMFRSGVIAAAGSATGQNSSAS